MFFFFFFALFSFQTYPATKGLLNKVFPHYGMLSYVFGKDHTKGPVWRYSRTSGPTCKDPSACVPTEDGLKIEFPTMCSPRMNLSLDDMMVGQSGRFSDCRSGLTIKKESAIFRHLRLMTSFRSPWTLRMKSLRPL